MLIDLENNGPFGIGLYITREHTDFNMMMTVSYYIPGQGFTSFEPLQKLVESGDKKKLFTVLSDFIGCVADPADPASFQPMLREDLEVAAVSAPLARLVLGGVCNSRRFVATYTALTEWSAQALMKARSYGRSAYFLEE
ncbi:MAG: hypothetical protein K6T29_10025 [Peptococcaceae bacterium]|nr:hypothetical protein [Peptococcaceae bacterium]